MSSFAHHCRSAPTGGAHQPSLRDLSGNNAAWVSSTDHLLGFGRTATYQPPAAQGFAAAQRWWGDFVASCRIDNTATGPGTGPVVFASFRFAPDHDNDTSGVLVVPSRLHGRTGSQHWVTTIDAAGSEPSDTGGTRGQGNALEGDGESAPTTPRVDGGPSGEGPDGSGPFPHNDQPVPAAHHAWPEPGGCEERTHRDTSGGGSTAQDDPLRPPAIRPADRPQVRFEPGTFTDDQWKVLVADAIAAMADGPLEKVVLARDRFVYNDSPWHIGRVLAHLAEHHPQCWTFLVDGLVGATPELLLRKRQGEVTSKVLAGTIPRTHDPVRDRTSAEHLLQSPRMREEHHHAVASLTAALQGLPLTISDPYVLELPSVLHLATDISAPAPDVHIFTLLERIHPTAAVAGTPKPLALETISELEHTDRGRYAGPVGWVDAHGDGEFGLALRCAHIDPATPRVARMFAGCGIMPASDPGEELCESDAKFAPMTTALWNTAHLL